MAAYRLSFGASLVAAGINAFFGFIVAWVLVRYSFPGKRLLDAMVDLPFALPTAVSGIALTVAVQLQGLDRPLAAPAGDRGGLHAAGRGRGADVHRPAVRGADASAGAGGPRPGGRGGGGQPGAGRLQTFWRVILPTVLPALLTGLRLGAGPRAGGVRFGRLHRRQHAHGDRDRSAADRREARPEQSYAGATAIGVVMLAASFLLLLMINLLAVVEPAVRRREMNGSALPGGTSPPAGALSRPAAGHLPATRATQVR